MDLFVQASDTEGLPNAILEAAAAGLPIVATAVGGTQEILTSEVDALLVPRSDVPRLADAIGRLADDPILRERLGHGARARAADYSPSQLVTATAALYREFASRSASVER
jgi:glycogen synthase